MPQYYYNVSDGQLALDDEGSHAVNIEGRSWKP